MSSLFVTPAIYRAFCIAEVANTVTAHVVNNDRSAKRSKADLLSIALANKTLYEPAMDAIWYTVHDFNRLLACLPQPLWHAVKCGPPPGPPVYYVFGEPPPRYKVELLRVPDRDEDWARFEHHARRVRCLKLEDLYISSSTLEAFARHFSELGGIANPFINLWSFSSSGPIETVRTCGFLFSLQVSKCNFDLCHTYPNQADVDFLRSLNHVRSLKLRAPCHDSQIAPTTCLSSAFASLCTLTLGDISAQTLYELHTLPRLETLRVTRVITADFAFPPVDPTTPSFSSLKSISIEAFHVPYPCLHSTFLSRYIRGTLQSIQFGTATYGSVNQAAYDGIIATLPLHPELRSLRLYGWWTTLKPDTPRINSDALSPLRECSKLESLELLGMDVQIGREDIEQMGRAWPQLRRLWITSLPDDVESYPQPTFTLSDLREFALHFPHLNDLSIPFDASTGMATPDHRALSHVSAPNMKYLGIPYCPLSESPSVHGQVAAFLSEVFPSASLDRSKMAEDAKYNNAMHVYDKTRLDMVLLRQWGAVSSLLVPLRKAKERAVASEKARNVTT